MKFALREDLMRYSASDEELSTAVPQDEEVRFSTVPRDGSIDLSQDKLLGVSYMYGLLLGLCQTNKTRA